MAVPGAGRADELLTAALRYANVGWRVFPVHGIRPGSSCTCGKPDCSSPGKHPRITDWPKWATVDAKRIVEWWRQWPEANVAIAPGKSMLILDVDGAKGLTSLAEHSVPRTPTVATARGHPYYLAAPKRIAATSRTGLLPGLDIKTEGGYVVAPPSLHATGGGSRWLMICSMAG